MIQLHSTTSSPSVRVIPMTPMDILPVALTSVSPEPDAHAKLRHQEYF